MDKAAQQTPKAVYIAGAAIVGFVLTAALVLWFERGPAILLDLKALSAAFLCF